MDRGDATMRVVIAGLLLFMGACATRRVAVPVPVSSIPRTDRLIGCLDAVHRAGAVNKTYRKALHGKILKPVEISSSGVSDDSGCIAALVVIGSDNARQRMEIERRAEAKKAR